MTGLVMLHQVTHKTTAGCTDGLCRPYYPLSHISPFLLLSHFTGQGLPSRQDPCCQLPHRPHVRNRQRHQPNQGKQHMCHAALHPLLVLSAGTSVI
jgi:hypothetical protein